MYGVCKLQIGTSTCAFRTWSVALRSASQPRREAGVALRPYSACRRQVASQAATPARLPGRRVVLRRRLARSRMPPTITVPTQAQWSSSLSSAAQAQHSFPLHIIIRSSCKPPICLTIADNYGCAILFVSSRPFVSIASMISRQGNPAACNNYYQAMLPD